MSLLQTAKSLTKRAKQNVQKTNCGHDELVFLAQVIKEGRRSQRRRLQMSLGLNNRRRVLKLACFYYCLYYDIKVKVKSTYEPIRPELILVSVAWSDWEYFYSPLDGMLAWLPPTIKFGGTHLYTWVERGTVRVKCLAQEHNTMSPARARTQTARSGVERAIHETTAPPTYYDMILLFILFPKE